MVLLSVRVLALAAGRSRYSTQLNGEETRLPMLGYGQRELGRGILQHSVDLLADYVLYRQPNIAITEK